MVLFQTTIRIWREEKGRSPGDYCNNLNEKQTRYMHRYSYNLFLQSPEIPEPMNTLQMKTSDSHCKINKQAQSQLEHHQPGARPEETGMIREPWRQMGKNKTKNGKDNQEKKQLVVST